MATASVRKFGNRPGRRVIDLTLAYATNATTITTSTMLTGSVMDVVFTVPDLSAGTQCTLSFVDEDSKTIYTSGLLDESTSHILTPGITFCGELTVKIVTAGDQSANRAFKIVMNYT